MRGIFFIIWFECNVVWRLRKEQNWIKFDSQRGKCIQSLSHSLLESHHDAYAQCLHLFWFFVCRKSLCNVFGFWIFGVCYIIIRRLQIQFCDTVCVCAVTTDAASAHIVSIHNAKSTILTFDLEKLSLYDRSQNGTSSGNWMCWIKVCQFTLLSIRHILLVSKNVY